MKQITVSGAVILRENNGKKEIFATQRGYGDWKGWWEIPGGKLNPVKLRNSVLCGKFRKS